MKKTNFSKFLVLILVLCMAFSMVVLTACSTNPEYTNEANRTDTDKQIVKNGDFTFASGSDYPRTPTSWTGTLGGSGSYQPEGGMDNIKAGVISVGKDYDHNKQKWNGYPNPQIHSGAKDNNMLMIYASKPSSYSYNGESFEISANEYYKLSFWVNTSPNLEGEKDNPDATFGAYVNVSGGNVRGEWIDIKTNGVWKKFEMYVEGASVASSTLRVTFGLGYGDKLDKHLTKGHVFFDDVMLEKLEDKDGVTAKQQYEQAKVNKMPALDDKTPDTTVASYEHKDSFKFSNAYFTNYNKYTKSNPTTYPTAWNPGFGGIDDDLASNIDKKPTIKRGLVNLDTEYIKEHKTAFGLDKYDAEKDVEMFNNFKTRSGSDNFALMLNADDNYAINYVSSSSITIEKGQIYRIGVWVKAIKTTDKDVKGTVTLSNDNEEYIISFDENNYYVNGETKPLVANKVDGWSELVFNVRGNNTHDVKYKMTLSLGTGGKSEQENWSCGHVLFDDINFNSTAIDIGTNKNSCSLDKWAIGYGDTYAINNNFINIDLNKIGADSKIENLVSNGNLVDIAPATTEGYVLPSDFSLTSSKSDTKFAGTINVVNAKTDATKVALPFEVIYQFGSDSLPAVSATNVLKIASNYASTVGFKHNSTFTAGMNKQYRLAFWVKTEEIAKTAGMNFYLKDEDGKVIDQISNVNSENIDKENDKYSGWQEVVFYISGSSEKDTKYTIEMSFGYGNNFDETLANGTAYLYNINLQNIDLSAYSNASTSSVAKKVELTKSTLSETPANGNFNKYVINATTSFDENGLINKFTTPQSWSVNNDKVPDDVFKYTEGEGENKVEKDKDVKKGILDLFNLTNIFKEEKIDGLIDASSIESIFNDTAKANKYALGIFSEKPVVYNYKSSSISLNAKSFYTIHVSVFTANGAKATVKLTSSSPHEEGFDSYATQESVGGWTEYIFFVRTGLSSATVNLELSLGDLDSYLNARKDDEKTELGLSSGLVLFDYAFVKELANEDVYKKFKAEKEISGKTYLELEFNTDGFATSSYDRSNKMTPNGWTQNAINLAPDINNKASTVAGVIDLEKKDANLIWEYSAKGETDKEKQEYKDFVNGRLELVDKVLADARAKESAENSKVNFGNSVLMIDNLIPTGYSVANSSGKELAKQKYYKVSIWIYADIVKNDDNLGLTLSLKISDRDQDVVKIENIQSTNGWTEFAFYVNNVNEIKETTLNAYLTMQLGTRITEDKKDIPKYVQGTVFADNFKIVEIEKADYDNAVADTDNKNIKTIQYIPDKPINPEEDKTPEQQEAPMDWTMLAWAIPTIVLAVMLIAVLGVFLYKKYAGPKKRTKFKGKKAPKAKKAEVTKKDNFDSFND